MPVFDQSIAWCAVHRSYPVLNQESRGFRASLPVCKERRFWVFPFGRKCAVRLDRSDGHLLTCLNCSQHQQTWVTLERFRQSLLSEGGIHLPRTLGPARKPY